MENTKKPSISKLLHPIGLGKRVLTFVIDMTMTLVVGVTFYATVSQSLIIGKSDYYEQRTALRENCVSSHLAYEYYCNECKSYWDPDRVTKSGTDVIDPNGHKCDQYDEPISYTMKDEDGSTWLDEIKHNGAVMHPYELYEEIIWDYYTSYLAADPIFNGKTVEGKTYAEYYTPKYVVNEIYGIKADSSGNPILDDSMYYEPAKDGEGHWNYDVQPVLRSEKGDISAKTVRDAVATYFNSSNDGLYVKAISNLKTQHVYLAPTQRMNVVAYLALIPAVLLPTLIFFMIIPLCLKDGKTLGKLILKEAVVGVDGFKAPVLSKILRNLFVLIGFELLLLPSTIIGAMLMMLYFAIGYMVLVMSKTSQALHDKLAKTVVVDAKTSLWFANVEAKEEYIATHPSSLAAKLDQEEKGINPDEEGGIKRVLVGESMPSAEEAGVLNLDTIAKFRKETDNITSFDEFEKKKEEEQKNEEEAKEEATKEEEEVVEPKAEEPKSDFADEE